MQELSEFLLVGECHDAGTLKTWMLLPDALY